MPARGLQVSCVRVLKRGTRAMWRAYRACRACHAVCQQETAANATLPCPPDAPNCHKLEDLGVPVSHWPWAEARAKRQWETRLARQLTRCVGCAVFQDKLKGGGGGE